MGPETLALLALVAFAAGALNSVAGGGSFLTFPTLLFAGVGAIPANATNTVALWPGAVAGAVGYREELTHGRRMLVVFGLASLAGGLVGALLLLRTPEQTFAQMVPWLLFAATVLFAVGPAVTRQVRREGPRGVSPRMGALALVQFAISVYGGYFGGGIGILMLAAFALMGMENLHAMNGLKVLLGAAINGVAVVAFVVADVIVWPAAAAMIVGSVLGGYFGARGARHVNPVLLRRLIVAIGALMSAYFFLR